MPLGRAMRELRDVFRASTATHRRLRDHLVVIVVATAGIDVICAVLGYMFERDQPGTQIKSFGDALFWTTTQLLTVSSQLRNPVTTGGRFLDVLMEVYAITVVATLAGSLGSFFYKRADELT